MLVAALAAALSLAAPASASWEQPNGDLRGTRAVASTITSSTVGGLHVRWRYPLTRGSTFGSFASTPLVVGSTVYVQDPSSSVHALDLRRRAAALALPRSGAERRAERLAVRRRTHSRRDRHARLRARRAHRPPSSGAGGCRRRRAIRRHRADRRGRPRLPRAVGFPPERAWRPLCARPRTGRDPLALRHGPRSLAAPERGRRRSLVPAVDRGAGRVYSGISNPGPWGGSRRARTAAPIRGHIPYTNSLVVLDGRTGRLLWYDQVTRHDVRDYDFEASPILVGGGGRPTPAVFGAGKAGRVVAWNRATGRRLLDARGRDAPASTSARCPASRRSSVPGSSAAC